MSNETDEPVEQFLAKLFCSIMEIGRTDWVYAYKPDSDDVDDITNTSPFKDLVLIKKNLGIKECMYCYFDFTEYPSLQRDGLECPLRWLLMPMPECDKGKRFMQLSELNESKDINIIPYTYDELRESNRINSERLEFVIGPCKFFIKTSEYATLSQDYLER